MKPGEEANIRFWYLQKDMKVACLTDIHKAGNAPLVLGQDVGRQMLRAKQLYPKQPILFSVKHVCDKTKGGKLSKSLRKARLQLKAKSAEGVELDLACTSARTGGAGTSALATQSIPEFQQLPLDTDPAWSDSDEGVKARACKKKP
eukprot:g71448.t1